ncbi:DUF742 domain-containing protein [Amycolatopsis sp., V23-08]|uniref:DUF742 domain-containing protein n=1 Tax=Amycolatopsis heterodermiae TaxID=3110235 RepID=A0ABU5QZS3_9PSEU|nr:DUF742 domain-containing protein [Amycolatopsis sp., V23-08]MEA5359005.1 DUF742 domain-containing protein [Amycolatopsis sp., V23-08]
MRISGFDDPDSTGWDALHRGTEREGFDSPSKFDMSTLSTIMPRRRPAQTSQPSQPQPDPQGYTDEDTREWGSSASSVEDDAYDDGYDPDQPEWQDEEPYEPEPPPVETWTPPRGAGRSPAPRPPAPRPPAPRPPVARPPRAQAAPPPAWAPPVDPRTGWTPPPDPETRWIPQAAEPYGYEEPAWNEPAVRAASPVRVGSAGSRVRPYTRTGGRTRSDHNLALEALVSTSDDGRRYRGVRSVEHRRICDLCLDTRSIAEIAAHLRLPLGVVKVLVGDMADIGLVLVHHTELILGDRSSRDFMERVLAGLRAL